MALITSQGYQLTPNVAPIAQRIGQLLQQKQQEQRQGEAIAKKEQAIKIKDESLRMALELNRIKQLPDNISKRTAIAKKSQEIIAQGGDPSKLTALLETTNPDELNMGLQKLSLEFGDAGKLYEQMLKASEPAADKIGTYNPRDYTVESFAEFRRTGDPGSLVRHTEKTVDIGGVPHRLVPGTVNKYEPIKTTTEVAESESEIAGAKETGKLKAQLKFKPQIETAVVAARKEAAERGEVLTDLNRMTAALPGLETAVSQLKGLSSVATYTTGGKIFDSALKETGFKATKGATARARFIAIVNNQVLPLLKETFGAAFTEKEGETLKATMGDPDSTPEEKMAQLDAFIDQKKRSIETKERQLAPPVATPPTQGGIKFLGFE